MMMMKRAPIIYRLGGTGGGLMMASRKEFQIKCIGKVGAH